MPDPTWARATLAVVVLGGCASAGKSTSGRETDLAIATRATFLHAGFGPGPVMFTDHSGTLLEERRAEPFGAAIGAPDVVARDLNVLNRRTNAATAWSDHGARWLAPETARWLTPDPPIEGPNEELMSAPWGLHPYQYVDQNPTFYWDADGREPKRVDPPAGESAPLRGTWITRLAARFGVYNDRVVPYAPFQLRPDEPAHWIQSEKLLRWFDFRQLVRQTAKLTLWVGGESFDVPFDPLPAIDHDRNVSQGRVPGTVPAPTWSMHDSIVEDEPVPRSPLEVLQRESLRPPGTDYPSSFSPLPPTPKDLAR